jgi:methyl-accepting chemotaxis protein
MLKNMKLGTKLITGFMCIVGIAVIMGAIAIYNMNAVSTIAQTMRKKHVPGTIVSNDIERSAQATMYQARGYGFTENESFLDQARKNLSQTMSYIEGAEKLAVEQTMEVLQKKAAAAKTVAAQYSEALEKTVELTGRLQTVLADSDAAAQNFIRGVGEYLDAQEKAMADLLEKNLTTAETVGTEQQRQNLQQEIWIRTQRITAANDILDEGNAVIQNTWRAIASRDPEHFRATLGRFTEINHMLEGLRKETRQEGNLRIIADCSTAANSYLKCMEQFLEAWLAREAAGEQRNTLGEQVLAAVKETAEYEMGQIEKGAIQTDETLTTATWIIVVGLSIGTAVGIFVAIFLTRAITKPINRIIAGLTEGAQQVASASGQVSSASQSLAEGATEQAAGLEETSSSLEEMSSMTKQNADNAQQASVLAGEARKAAQGGAESMQRMSRAIDDIQKSSDETAKIIKVIDEIAFQTNLLALNAAVEAARAGEAGKGFAVVAEEVRNLAMRSAEAAKNTANMIEESVKNAKNGVAISGEVSKALGEIVDGIAKTTDLVGEIAAASAEQAQGIDQVNTAVAQMDKVTQQNAANAEESASASEELSAQAEAMQGIVEELVALVQGASGGRLQGRGQSPRRAAGSGSHKALGLGDQTFHHIAEGPKKASRSAGGKAASTTTAGKSLPLDDDFSDFSV